MSNQQARALSKDSPSNLSWRAISSMYATSNGRRVDGTTLYSEFKRKYDKNKEMFDRVVANFDEHGVTLKTSEEEVTGGNDTNDAKKTVDSMAKRAAAKKLK